jgi:hypothetical protein
VGLPAVDDLPRPLAARRCRTRARASSASKVRPAAMSARPQRASSISSRWIRSRSRRWQQSSRSASISATQLSPFLVMIFPAPPWPGRPVQRDLHAPV